MLLPLVARFGWKGGLVAVVLYFVGSRFLGGGGGGAPQQQAVHDDARAFVGTVLDDAQQTWARTLGSRYTPAHVVLYSEATQTACGFGEAAVGPFYCPRDGKVYLDVTFFRALHDRFGAPGDFAQAYVIAHEIGHHVQRELGAHSASSVQTELQADCYAGVWAQSANKRGLLDTGDVDEAVRAAASVGDDRLQRQSTGVVQPEKWTHGSSEQRARAFKKGYDGGDPAACAG